MFTTFISGHYNQRDMFDLILPWTCRTPKELARLCIDAMDMNCGTLDLPESPFLAIDWNRVPALEALTCLAAAFDRRVDLNSDRHVVNIVRG